MSTRTFLAAALFAAAIQSPTLAQQVPQALESYKPHEIVEAVISEARRSVSRRTRSSASTTCTCPCATNATVGPRPRGTRRTTPSR